MIFKILKEKNYSIENNTRTDSLVSKIATLTNSGKNETEEMKTVLKSFDIALKTEKYELPSTILEFKQQIMNIVAKLSDEEYSIFMKNISTKENILSLNDIVTNGKRKTINSINPEWIPEKIRLPLINITKDKMGSGEIYFSMLTGGDKKKKGDVNVDGTIIEVKYNKGWLIEFPNTIRAIEEAKEEIYNVLIETNESLSESINPKNLRATRRAIVDLKKYVKNNTKLELIANLLGTKIKMKSTSGSYSFMVFNNKIKLTNVEIMILSLLNEAATVLKWLYKPVSQSSGPFYNELTYDVISYLKSLNTYLKGNNPSKSTKVVITNLDELLDKSEGALKDIKENHKKYETIASQILKTDSKYFLFATTKKSLWNDVYQAYKNKFENGEERFKKMFKKFIDKSFNILPTNEIMKNAFDNVSIDTDTILKNIAEYAFTKYSKNDKWTYLLTISNGGKYYGTFDNQNEFRKAMDSMVIKPSLNFNDGQSASVRLYIEMLNV